MPNEDTPRKSHKLRKFLLIGGGALFALIMIIVVSNQGSSTPTTATGPLVSSPAPETSTMEVPAPTPAPAPVPAGPQSNFGQGQFEVGTDIVVGKYRSPGPIESSVPMCYVEISKDASGSFDSIVSNDVENGPAIITLKRGQFVKNSGCQDFVKIS